jgi:hypothetical protein
LKILLYCNIPNDSEKTSTVINHIDSFENHSLNDIECWSSLSGLPNEDKLGKFDCLVIHYSISLIFEKYISRQTLDKIKSFKGMKILFIQDEYRRVNFICNKINYAEIDMVYTCAPKSVSQKLYSRLNKSILIHTTLTGYVPDTFANIETRIISQRKIDVGYRARKCPFFLGRKGIQKYLIGRNFLENKKSQELICDISCKEKDRLYGKDWIDFLSNCKTTLGTESGSSIIDFVGDIEYNLNFYQAFHPFATFDDVPKEILKSDGELEIQVISPRCFEAAALGTVLVLYPGSYSGILVRDKHYIGLEKDFSNINEVVEKIKDLDSLQEMANFTRKALVESGNFSYKKFVNEFDKNLDMLMEKKNFKSRSIIGDKTSLSSDKIESVKCRKKSFVRDLLYKFWKILPEWARFILMVTLLRKKYFCHFNKEKYSYLES